MKKDTSKTSKEKSTDKREKRSVSTDHPVGGAAGDAAGLGIANVGKVAKPGTAGANRKYLTRQELIVLVFVIGLLVALVLYFARISRRDDMRIGYIKEDFYGSSLNHEVAARQLNNPNLKACLLRALRSESTRYSADKCIEWLRGGDWDDACANSAISAAEIVRDELEEHSAHLKADIETIEHRQGSHEAVLLPLQSTNYVLLSSMFPAERVGSLEVLQRATKQCGMELESLGSLLDELKRVRQEENRSLTGRVDLLVAILNNSEHDHIVKGKATLIWEAGELEVQADRDTTIRSRSVEEIRFVIDRKALNDILTRWEALVSHRLSKDYQIRILTDQGALQERGTLFKNGDPSHHYFPD